MSTNLEKLALKLDLVLSELMHRLRVNTARECGLTGIQFFTLRYIVRQKQLTVTDIASTLNVTLSAVTGLVNRLVNMGLVKRQQDQGDRRVVWIQATEKGIALMEKANTIRAKDLNSFLRKLPPEMLEDFETVCDKLVDIMDLAMED